MGRYSNYGIDVGIVLEPAAHAMCVRSACPARDYEGAPEKSEISARNM